jgi:3-isopropylmalate/(R)-2-methylmalate dehydratase small subunit
MKGPMEEMARHCLEAIDPAFADRVRPGDVIVAGENFGMGSSREQAAQALVHLGVGAVVARSFAGIFYRNAFNNGLPVLVCAEAGRIEAGARIRLDPSAGVLELLDSGEGLACEPVPEHLMALVRHGGLVPYLEHRLTEERKRR